jgi:ABC-type phosphate transport system substrate-binding protein
MKKIVISYSICITSLLFISFDVSREARDSIVVIVNKDNPVSALTAGEVKLYYLRKIKKRWPVINKNIRPADRRKQCDERTTFYSMLEMNDAQIEQYFVNKQLQNAERPPDKFATETEMINFVAEEIGAIGYMKAISVTPEITARVKVVFTLNQ